MALLVLAALVPTAARALETAPGALDGAKRSWIGYGAVGIGMGTGFGTQVSVVAGKGWTQGYVVVEVCALATEWQSSPISSPYQQNHSFQVAGVLLGGGKRFGRHRILIDAGIADVQQTSDRYATKSYNYQTDREVIIDHPEEKRFDLGAVAKVGYRYTWSHVGLGGGASLFTSGKSIDGVLYVDIALGWL